MLSPYYQAGASNPADDTRLMGCCSCCWLGGSLLARGKIKQTDSSCKGSCAHICRSPALRNRLSPGEETQTARKIVTPMAVARRPASAFTGCPAGRSAGAKPEWHVAYEHICRLMNAADAPTEAQGAQLAEPAERISTSRSGSGSSSGSSSARRNPRLVSLLAGLLSFDPDKRLTPFQALAHPFFGEALPFAVPLAAERVPQMTASDRKWAASSLAQRPSVPSAERSSHGVTAARGCEENRRPTGDGLWSQTFEPTAFTLARPVALSGPYQPERPPPSSYSGGADGGHQALETAPPESNGRGPDQNNAELSAPRVPASQARSTTLPRPMYASSTPCSDMPPLSSSPTNTRNLREADRLGKYEFLAKTDDGDTREGDGASRPSEISRVAVVPLPRKNRFLNALILAGLKPGLRQELPAAETDTSSVLPRVSSERQPEAPQTRPDTAVGRSEDEVATTPGRRRPNRFLSPATMAKLHPDLVKRDAKTTAAAEVERATTEVERATTEVEQAPKKTGGGTAAAVVETTPTISGAAATKKLTKRALLDTSAGGNSTLPVPRKAARMVIQDLREDPSRPEMYPETLSRRGRPRSPSKTDGRKRAVGSARQAGRAGRATPRRRAALAAGVALLRLQNNESESEYSSS